MSTQKNEHNPETELTSKAEDWSVLKPFLRTTESVEIGSKSVVGHNRISIWREADDLVILHVPGHPCDYRLSNESIERLLSDLTTARRITPPTDTTGSGREGETPTHNEKLTPPMALCDILQSETQPIDGHGDHGAVSDAWRSLREQIEFMESQLEALRRDGERLDWLETHPFMAYRDRDPADGKIDGHFTLVDEDRGRKHGRRGIVEPTLRAAIDSAQRQEGR